MSETDTRAWPFDDADQHDPLTALRIPVVRNPHPRWKYEVCVVINDPEDRSFDPPLWGYALRPDEAEVAMIAAELEWRMCYYNEGWKAKMRQRPLDVDGTTNTVILQKFGEGDWRYKRATWEHGMWPFHNMEERFTLEKLLDHINDYGGEPNPKWRAFKAERPEVFPASAEGGVMAPAIDEADKRSERVDSRVSPRELALIAKLADEQDMPTSQWVRDAILEKLRSEAGYEDEARRAAPRRRNYRPRAKGGQQREEGQQS